MAWDSVDISVDFPAFGNPIIPTSAISFSSSSIHLSSPFSPSSAVVGVWFVGDLNAALPLPPFPPLATTTLCPFSVRSAIISPVSASFITVPTGTFSTRSSADLPCLFEPEPGCPFFAL